MLDTPAVRFITLDTACPAGGAEGCMSGVSCTGSSGDLHRELAGNAPAAGFASGRAGTPLDRNVILPLRAPFRLARLHSD